jgi:hypothetical protein
VQNAVPRVSVRGSGLGVEDRYPHEALTLRIRTAGAEFMDALRLLPDTPHQSHGATRTFSLSIVLKSLTISNTEGEPRGGVGEWEEDGGRDQKASKRGMCRKLCHHTTLPKKNENLFLPMLLWIFVTIRSAQPNMGVKSVCCSIWFVLA